MEQTENPLEMMHFIQSPIFFVKDGIITETNSAAKNLMFQQGTSIMDYITRGADEYSAFRSGKLCLELRQGRAWVSACSGGHLFSLEEIYSSPELQALALAAQNLRLPLSNAVSGTELLLQENIIQQSDALKQQLGQINRSLYQIMRAVGNMSDISELDSNSYSKLRFQNIPAVLGEIFEKAAPLAADAQRELLFRNLKNDVHGYINSQLIERAINSTIQVTLKQKENRLVLTFENSIQDGCNGIYGNAFSRYLRQPGIETGQNGIGLGMSVISSAASAHRGTVLLEMTRKNSIRVTLSFPVRTELEAVVRSPISIFEEYAGGFDNYLIELSDVLPAEYYESI